MSEYIEEYQMRPAKKLPLFVWIFLTLPGWAVAYLTSNPGIADAASIVGCLISFKLIWSSLGDPGEMIRFARLGAVALCAIQNMSWLMASALHRFALRIPIEQSLSDIVDDGTGVGAYCLGVLYAGLFAVSLAWMGSVKGLATRERDVLSSLGQVGGIPLKRLMMTIVVCMLIEAAMVGSGVIGQRSMVVSGYGEGKLPWWLPLYESLLMVHLLLNGLCFVKQLQARRQGGGSTLNWWIILGSVLLVSFLFFSKGRRSFVFSILAHGWWGCFFLARRPRFVATLFVAAVVYPVVTQVLAFSNFIRSSAAKLENSRGSAIEVIPDAWRQFLANDGVYAEVSAERNTSNLATRPLVARVLAQCMHLPENQKNFMWEKDILHSLIWTIPGPLFPDKTLYPKQESLLYEHFRLGAFDIADSLYLSAYTCFGWAGLIVYPLFVVVLWFMVIVLVRSRRIPPMIVVVIISSWLMTFMLDMGEGSAGRMLVQFRSTLLWVVIGWVVSVASKKGRSHIPDHMFELSEAGVQSHAGNENSLHRR